MAPTATRLWWGTCCVVLRAHSSSVSQSTSRDLFSPVLSSVYGPFLFERKFLSFTGFYRFFYLHPLSHGFLYKFSYTQ